ncbi:MAG: hypothetical protein ACLGHY_00055 [Gammaproteobacteria bacterium]
MAHASARSDDEPLDERPITTRIVSRQLEQLRSTGLFLALTGGVEQAFTPIRSLYEVTGASIAAARGIGALPPLTPVPVVYNPSTWRSDQLCGYVGLDLEAGPDELLASYVEHWLGAARIPRVSSAHFLKCALWFTEKHDRDPAAGLLFLLDLFDHGFFARWQVFSDALEGFLMHCALGSNLAFLFGATLADSARINQGLAQLAGEQEGRAPEPDQLEPLVAALVELTLDRAQRARQAETLDEWLIREGQVCGPAWFLGPLHAVAGKVGFGIVTRSLLSRIEEMSADRHASVLMARQQATDALPPAWDVTRFKDIAEGYRERFPGEDWLEQLRLDRLLMPDRVIEIVRQSGADPFDRSELPPPWRLPSEWLALSYCIAHGRRPAEVRSVDFDPRRLEAQVRAMGRPADSHEARVAARRRLSEQERAVLMEEAMNVADASEQSVRKLAAIRRLYPWHPLPCRLAGIAAGLRGDLPGALDALMKAVALEPEGPEHWAALARLAESTGRPEDAAALNTITRQVAAHSGAPR